MADPITLPPLPDPYTGLATNLKEMIRARDIEVARLVLEAAAQTCKQKAGRMRNMRDYAGGNALDHAAMLINELQVRHHE